MGFFHGLMFLPVILSLFGPINPKKISADLNTSCSKTKSRKTS